MSGDDDPPHDAVGTSVAAGDRLGDRDGVELAEVRVHDVDVLEREGDAGGVRRHRAEQPVELARARAALEVEHGLDAVLDVLAERLQQVVPRRTGLQDVDFRVLAGLQDEADVLAGRVHQLLHPREVEDVADDDVDAVDDRRGHDGQTHVPGLASGMEGEGGQQGGGGGGEGLEDGDQDHWRLQLERLALRTCSGPKYSRLYAKSQSGYTLALYANLPSIRGYHPCYFDCPRVCHSVRMVRSEPLV